MSVELCHFPRIDAKDRYDERYKTWRPDLHGENWLLHGHTHSRERIRPEAKQIHVGCDAWGWACNEACIDEGHAEPPENDHRHFDELECRFNPRLIYIPHVFNGCETSTFNGCVFERAGRDRTHVSWHDY